MAQNRRDMKMKMIVVSCLMLCQLTGVTQEETSWWKKLFKKETVEEMATEPKEEEVIEKVNEDSVELAPMDSSVERMRSGQGLVTVHTSEKLDQFNQERIENPVDIQGYRIQVYHGNLKIAKEERAKFLADSDEFPCYLVSLSPNFAVRVGDFRSELEAHKYLADIRENYPKAYVVPDKIEPPAVGGIQN